MHVLLFTPESRAAVVKSQQAKSRLPVSLILKESCTTNLIINFSRSLTPAAENVTLLHSTQLLPQDQKKEKKKRKKNHFQGVNDNTV